MLYPRVECCMSRWVWDISLFYFSHFPAFMIFRNFKSWLTMLHVHIRLDMIHRRQAHWVWWRLNIYSCHFQENFPPSQFVSSLCNLVLQPNNSNCHINPNFSCLIQLSYKTSFPSVILCIQEQFAAVLDVTNRKAGNIKFRSVQILLCVPFFTWPCVTTYSTEVPEQDLRLIFLVMCLRRTPFCLPNLNKAIDTIRYLL
jgi:hypothetical protein